MILESIVCIYIFFFSSLFLKYFFKKGKEMGERILLSNHIPEFLAERETPGSVFPKERRQVSCLFSPSGPGCLHREVAVRGRDNFIND